MSVKLNGHCLVTNKHHLILQILWKIIGQPPVTLTRHVAWSASGNCVPATEELSATIEIEDKTVSRKIYVADSRHKLWGFDFIESLGLLNIPFNSVWNAVCKSEAQSAITEQTDDIKHFFPQFSQMTLNTALKLKLH